MRGCGSEIIKVCTCYYWIFDVPEYPDLFG